MKQKLLLSSQSLEKIRGSLKDPKELHEYKNGNILISVDRLPKKLPPDAIKIKSGIPIKKGVPVLSLETFGKEEEILAYIELIGPVAQEWLKSFESENIEILRYQPNNAYLCRAKAMVFQKVQQFDYVQEVRYLSANYKPSTVDIEGGKENVWILFTGKLSNQLEIVDTLNTLLGVEVTPNHVIEQVDYYLRIKANVSTEGKEKLLTNHFVVAIESVIEAQSEDEVANLIIAGQYSASGIPQGDYQQWLQDHNLDGTNVTVAIVDTGVDGDHEAFLGRFRDLAGGRKGWHGTFVAGHVAGGYTKERDDNGFIYGIGIAPKANILSIDNAGVTENPKAKARESIQNVGPNGQTAYIQNNSWGAGTKEPMNYTSLEAVFDRIVRNAASEGSAPQPLVICFSAGNSGSRGLTRPKAAKNVIVTGNSENYRPDVAQSFSDNIDDVYQDESWQPSSHGNCGDGRIRPDIVAPGEWTSSINYDVQPHQAEYLSSNLVWGGGTSGASPKTAGACALLTQWWRQRMQGKTPSPAMLKALLVNGAEPMQSAISKPPIPSKVQGWGRLHLDTILSPDIQFEYVDQTKLLKTVGDKWEAKLSVTDMSRPLKITLVWTDPPANINTGTDKNNSTIVNRLRLKVTTADGRVFYGNHFSNGWSTTRIPSSSESYEDNLQNVFIQVNDLTDTCMVEIEALDITTNCFDFQHKNPQQDFALVIQNANANTNTANTVLVIDDTNNDDTEESIDDSKNDSQWENTNYDENTDDDNEWWEEEPFDWFGEETTQNNETATRPNNSTDIQTGVSVFESQPIFAKDQVVSTVPITTTFGKTIRQLLHKWENESLEKNNNAIFAVNQKTILSEVIFRQLRQLSYLGNLYFLSAHQDILCQLAQGIHRKKNVHYRLITNPEKWNGHVRDTVAETSGAEVAKISKGKRNQLKLYSVDLTVNDEKVALRITNLKKLPKQFKLEMPNGKQINLHKLSTNQKKWINWQQRDQRIDVNINMNYLSEIERGGRWILLTEAILHVKGWIWGQRLFNHALKTKMIQNGKNKLLITIKNQQDSGLHQLSFLKRWICSDKNNSAVESQQRVLPRKRTPYTTNIVQDENALITSVRLLEDYITMESDSSNPVILDIIIRVDGVDRLGNPFQRVIRTNYLQFIPLSENLQRKEKEHFVAANIVRLYYRGGIVGGVRLHSQYGERDFLVNDSMHSKLLNKWKNNNSMIQFGIVGKHIKSLVLSSSL